MDYQEFKGRMIAEMEAAAERNGMNVTLEEKTITKINDVQLDAVVLRGEGNVAPTVYLNNLYQAYENGEDIETIAAEVVPNAMVNPFGHDLNVGQQMEWDDIKDKVFFHAMGEAENHEYQKNIPTREELDLLLAYRVLLSDDEAGRASFQITDGILNRLGVTEEELYQTAAQNMSTLFPAEIKSMSEMIMGLYEDTQGDLGDLDDVLESLPKETGMYVLSNSQKYYGAATAFYPGVMDKIADSFDTDMFVLPSSIHETILIPRYPEMEMSVADLKNMVSEINATQVGPEEVLKDQVYVFDKDEKKLMIGDVWQAQKQEKDRSEKKSIKERLEEKKVQVGQMSPGGKKSVGHDMEH